MGKKLLYGLLALAYGLGLAWLALSHSGVLGNATAKCTFKQLTGIPCATCGTTRSVKLVFAGDLAGAFWMNPLGVAVAVVMVLLPLWLLYDALSKRQTLFDAYKKAERTWPLKPIAWIAAGLLLLNWVWNVGKGI